MIWAFLAWYFLGGTASGGAILTSAGVADLRERVTVVVEDKARARIAAALLNDLKKDVKAFESDYSKSGKLLNELYSDHADNRRQVQAALDALNAAWEEGQGRALDARFALRDVLTEKEWAALFARQ
jgi:hypothetical protein